MGNTVESLESLDRSFTRLWYVFIQSSICVYLWVVAGNCNGFDIIACGAVSTVLLMFLIREEVLRQKSILTPHVIYLIASLLRLGLSSIWLGSVLQYGNHELLRVGRWNVEENIVYGLFLLQFGDLLLNSGYFLVDTYSAKAREDSFFNVTNYKLRGCLLLYLIGWSVKLFLHFVQSVNIPAVVGYIALALPMLAATRLLNMQETNVLKGRLSIILFLVVMTTLDLALAFQSYMKSAVLMVLLPFVVFFLKKVLTERASSLKGKTFGLTFGFVAFCFIGLIVFPFSQLRRASYNIYSKTYGLSVTDCLVESFRAAIPGSFEFQQIHRFPSSGFWGLLHRHCNTFTAAWSFTYVEQQGALNGDILMSAFPALVPRMLWPDKPPYSPSAKVSVMIGFAKSVETATTSTDAGSMSGGLFLDLGWIGLCTGMFLNGITLALVTRLLIGQSTIFSGLGWMVMYSACSNHFEASLDGNVTSWAVVFVISVFPTLLYNRYKLLLNRNK